MFVEPTTHRVVDLECGSISSLATDDAGVYKVGGCEVSCTSIKDSRLKKKNIVQVLVVAVIWKIESGLILKSST